MRWNYDGITEVVVFVGHVIVMRVERMTAYGMFVDVNAVT